jgi:hypothetical protein
LVVGLAAGFFFGAFFASLFSGLFRGFFSGRLRLELRRLAMKCLAAPRTVDGSRLGQRVAEVPSTGALGLERVVAADDAVSVVCVIRAKASAHGAALGGRRAHAET